MGNGTIKTVKINRQLGYEAMTSMVFTLSLIGVSSTGIVPGEWENRQL